MGFKHRDYLSGTKVYSCCVCRSHMATIESMISRRFNGQHGQAYLFDAVFNIVEGEAEDRPMTTGLHRVRDISCAKCGQTMGWKYDKAYEQSQKYKEGKSILEKALLIESSPAPSHVPTGELSYPSSSPSASPHRLSRSVATTTSGGNLFLPSFQTSSPDPRGSLGSSPSFGALNSQALPATAVGGPGSLYALYTGQQQQQQRRTLEPPAGSPGGGSRSDSADSDL